MHSKRYEVSSASMAAPHQLADSCVMWRRSPGAVCTDVQCVCVQPEWTVTFHKHGRG